MTRARDLADGKFDTDVEVENSSGATLKLTSTDTTGADTELLGQIDFVSSDSSTGSAGTQARIKGVYEDNGDSSGIAFITGASTGSGTPTISEKMRIRHEGNVGIGVSDVRHPLHIAYSETGSIPTDHQIGASSDNKNYIGIHNTSDSATYSGIALETRTTGASRWLIANERQDNFLGDLVFLTRDGGSSGSEVVRIQNNGNVGIGVTPTQKLHVSGNAIVTGIARLGDGSASSPAYQFVSDTNTGMFRVDSDKLAFSTGGTERFRVDDSGHLNYACTTISPGLGNTDTGIAIRADSIIAASSASGYVSINRNGDGTRIQFNNSGNTRGTITVTGTTTAYNTSSDRRLKSNIQDAASASAKIDAMKVRQFDWTEDGKHQDYGMIAQELQSIEPLAVSGSEDSNKMMGVDYSILVPMLIKEIQELRSRVAALEAS